MRRPLVIALCNTEAYNEAAIVLGQIVRPRRGQQEAPESGKDEEAEAAAALLEEAPLHEEPGELLYIFSNLNYFRIRNPSYSNVNDFDSRGL